MYMETVIVRVDLGGLSQILFALANPAGGQVNLRGLEEKFGVSHAGRERLVHRVERCGESAVAVQSSGQRGLGKDVLP